MGTGVYEPLFENAAFVFFFFFVAVRNDGS